MFKFSKSSLDNLKEVHPDLVRVVHRAIHITPNDFGVVQGARDLLTQQRYVAEGKSKTLNSKHLIQKDGYSHAVDLCCYDNKGKLTEDLGWWRFIIQAMMTAAIIERVPIRAGGLWRTFIDVAHFELDSMYWPIGKEINYAST